MDRTEGHCTFDIADGPPALGRRLGAPGDASDREAALYARYVRALAMLCECAPWVDEPDHVDGIEAILADAASNHPLVWRRHGCLLEIAPSGFAAVDADRR